MKRIVTFCALCALWGCRSVVEPSGDVIALSYSTSEQSKTDVLTSGDQISVFACMEGTEDCFLEAAKFIVGADGRSLDCGSPVYYPDPKQAVRFFACFPYHTGTFSVPTDQSTALALKQADLCWAMASSTPVASAVPLEFTHQMARLLITTNQPTTKIVAPNVCSGGTLNIRTGVFTNTLKSDISTTGNELIVPVQPLARLVLTVSGVEYVFAPTAPINLTEAQTTTISLTLNSTTKTATLSGSSTTNWINSANESNPTQAVSNILTLHWPSYLPQGAVPDKVVLTINNTDYTVSSGITYADKTFTVPFASSTLRYPYTISKIAFTSLPPCTQLLGATIYKSSASTVGIKDQGNAVLINGILWATGNLIADGVNGCKIGAPGDCGLYFQFGSLVGWSGGSSGSGVGQGSPALDKAIWPSAMGASKPSYAWPANYGSATGDRTTVVDQYFFNYNVAPYSNTSQDIRGFSGSFTGDAGSGNLGSGRYAKWGVGDPCTYYLGGTWRLPTGAEYAAMCNNKTVINQNYSWSDAGGTWVPGSGGNLASNQLFFPASGYRIHSTGLFGYVSSHGTSWSSSVYNAMLGLSFYFHSSWVYPQYYSNRSYGFPVRCVSN